MRQAIGERLSVHQFKNQELRAAGFFEPIDRADVGMVQRGEELCFSTEAGNAFGIVRETLGEDLHGDVAIELRVARLVDLAHAARTESREDFVPAEPSAWGQRQGSCRDLRGLYAGVAPHKLTAA